MELDMRGGHSSMMRGESKVMGYQCIFCTSHKPGLPFGLSPRWTSADLLSNSRASGNPSLCTRRTKSWTGRRDRMLSKARTPAVGPVVLGAKTVAARCRWK